MLLTEQTYMLCYISKTVQHTLKKQKLPSKSLTVGQSVLKKLLSHLHFKLKTQNTQRKYQ